MLYPKEDKENRILLYAVFNYSIILQFLIYHLFSAVVVNITRQQRSLAFMSIRLHMK